MTTISAGANPTITLPAGSKLVFSAGGAGLATVLRVGAIAPLRSMMVGAAPVTIGPFPHDHTISVACERALTYILGTTTGTAVDAVNGGSFPAQWDATQAAPQLQSLVSGVEIFETTGTYDGLMDARARAIAVGGVVKIKLKDAQYDMRGKAAIQALDGISYEGVQPVFVRGATDTIPAISKGTRFIGDPDKNCFENNPVDAGAPYGSAVLLQATVVQSASLKNIYFSGFKNAVKYGSLYNGGCYYTRLESLYARDCAEWGFWIENSGHITVGVMKAWNCTLGQIMFTASSNALYNYGNSVFYELYGAAYQHKQKGIWFACRKTNSTYNHIVVNGIQSNRQTLTQISSSAAFTNGSAVITLGAGVGATLDLDMPVSFSGSNGNGFYAGQVYYIVDITGDTVQLSDTVMGTPKTSSGTTGLTLVSQGHANIQIGAYDGATQFQPITLNGVDTENSGTVGVSMQNVMHINALCNLVQAGRDTTCTNTFTARGVGNGFIVASNNVAGVSVDFDAASQAIVMGARSSNGATGSGSNQGLGLWVSKTSATTTGYAQNSMFLSMVSGGGGLGIDGNGNLYGTRGIKYGQKTFAAGATIGSTGGQGHSWIYTGAGGGAALLPNVSNTNPTANVGQMLRVVNTSGGTLTLSTVGGTQNIVAGGSSATSNVIADSTCAEYIACDKSGTLFWARIG